MSQVNSDVLSTQLLQQLAAHHSDYCSLYFHVVTLLCVAFPVVPNRDDVIGVAGCVSEIVITVIVASGKDIAIWTIASDCVWKTQNA